MQEIKTTFKATKMSTTMTPTPLHVLFNQALATNAQKDKFAELVAEKADRFINAGITTQGMMKVVFRTPGYRYVVAYYTSKAELATKEFFSDFDFLFNEPKGYLFTRNYKK